MKVHPKKKKQKPTWLVILIIYAAVFAVLVLLWISGSIIGKMQDDRYNAALNMPATLILPTPCYTATARAAMTATVEGVPKPTPQGTKAVYCWEKKK